MQFREEEKSDLLQLDIETFWHKLYKCKNYEENYVFSNLTKLANMSLILPHSNAHTERVFSTVTDVKSKKRNKLSDDMLNAVCVLRTST